MCRGESESVQNGRESGRRTTRMGSSAELEMALRVSGEHPSLWELQSIGEGKEGEAGRWGAVFTLRSCGHDLIDAAAGTRPSPVLYGSGTCNTAGLRFGLDVVAAYGSRRTSHSACLAPKPSGSKCGGFGNEGLTMKGNRPQSGEGRSEKEGDEFGFDGRTLECASLCGLLARFAPIHVSSRRPFYGSRCDHPVPVDIDLHPKRPLVIPKGRKRAELSIVHRKRAKANGRSEPSHGTAWPRRIL